MVGAIRLLSISPAKDHLNKEKTDIVDLKLPVTAMRTGMYGTGIPGSGTLVKISGSAILFVALVLELIYRTRLKDCVKNISLEERWKSQFNDCWLVFFKKYEALSFFFLERTIIKQLE